MTDHTDRAPTTDPGFRQLVECLPVGVVVYRQGKVLYLNAMLRSYLGLAQDPVNSTIDELIKRFFVGSDVAAALARVALFEQPESQTAPLPPIERHLLGADGRPRVAELKTVSVHFDGEPAHLTMIRDLTDERRVQARLASLDRMAALGAVASGLAHELNNPLAVLLGHLELLVEKVPAALQSAEFMADAAHGDDLLTPIAHSSGAEDVRQLLSETSHSAAAVREVMAAFRSLTVAAKASKAPAAEPPPKQAPLQPARRGSLLVIDDDPLVASIIQRVLAAEHDVRVEVSALAALQLLQTEFFDAVVTDVMMPDLSGIALFEVLQVIRPAQAERLVFVTGGVWAGDAEDSLVATGRPILEKPFDIETLRGTIRRIVELSPLPLPAVCPAAVDQEPPSP